MLGSNSSAWCDQLLTKFENCTSRACFHHQHTMSDEYTPSQQSIRCTLTEVTPPNHPAALNFACAANDHCTCVQLFNEVQQIIPTLLSLSTSNRCTLSLNKNTKFSQNIGCVGAGGHSCNFLYPKKIPIPTHQDGML